MDSEGTDCIHTGTIQCHTDTVIHDRHYSKAVRGSEESCRQRQLLLPMIVGLSVILFKTKELSKNCTYRHSILKLNAMCAFVTELKQRGEFCICI